MDGLVSQRRCPPGGEKAHLGIFTKHKIEVIRVGWKVIMGDLDDVLHNDPSVVKSGKEF